MNKCVNWLPNKEMIYDIWKQKFCYKSAIYTLDRKMTRKITLFLTCSFEVALILFFSGWTAFAEVKVYIPEQEPTPSQPMSSSWHDWLTRDKTHRFLCQDNQFIEIRDNEIKKLSLKPRIISVKYYTNPPLVELYFDKLHGKKKSYLFSNNDNESDGHYTLFYEPMGITIYKADSWGKIKLGQEKGEYSIFLRTNRMFVYHAAGTCEYTEL